MDWIKAQLDKYRISTHTVAAVWAFLVLAYSTNTTFHDYVYGVAMAVYADLPHWLAGLVVGAIIPLIMLYKSAHKPAA